MNVVAKGAMVACVVCVCALWQGGCVDDGAQPWGVPEKGEMIGVWTRISLDSSYREDSNGDGHFDISTGESRTVGEVEHLYHFTPDEWTSYALDARGAGECYRMHSARFDFSPVIPGEFVSRAEGYAWGFLREQVSALKSGSQLRIRHAREEERDSRLVKTLTTAFYRRYDGAIPPSEWPSRRCQ